MLQHIPLIYFLSSFVWFLILSGPSGFTRDLKRSEVALFTPENCSAQLVAGEQL